MLGVTDGIWTALAAVCAAMIAAVASMYGAFRSSQIHKEVKSPNGMPTANLTYEAWKAVVEVREQVAELREAQVEGWARSHRATARAESDRVRLEGKVDAIATEQQGHHAMDELRFALIFGRLGVSDPTE